MRFFIFGIFIVGCMASEEPSRAAVPGKCPTIEFVKDFVPSKVIGKWHSIYETGKQDSCVCFEFEEAAPNHFHGHFYHLNATITFDPVNVDNYQEGFVVKAKFHPLLDNLKMSVFSSDYESYAGIFSCKEVGDFHFPKFSFLSRTYALSDEKFEEMKEVLSRYEGIDLSKIKTVNHDSCPY